MKRSAWIAALAALAAGCGGLEQGTESEAMMGRNGVGPNMMGRNSFVPGGIASNGLGPNYAAEAFDVVQTAATDWDVRNARFDAWFRSNPAEHEKAMGYFTRCMLPEGYGLTYTSPATGIPYRWPGQYGVAFDSIRIGRRMTRDEGLWMSSCMLAHVNTKGTHQYISIRGAKPVAGLATSDGEHWTMRTYHGAYFADLFTSPLEPLRWACQQPKVACSNKENLVCTPPPWYLDIVLGRSCDGYTCSFFNTLTGKQEPLVQNVGWCGDPALVRHSGEAWSPLYSYATAGTPAATGASLRPVFVNGPVFVDFELAVGAPAAVRTPDSLFEVVSTGTAPVTDKHVVTCAFQSCLRPLWDTADANGRKLRLTPGVVVEAMVRYLPAMWATGMEPRPPQIAPGPDMKTQFTAVFRYSNGKTALGRQAAAVASLAVSDTARQFRRINALWPVTYDAGGKPSWDAYQYLQVWPVTGTYDAAKAGANPFLMAAVIGLANSPACTGPINSLSPYPSCMLGDSPHLDAVAFVPGKPWCMPAGATSFTGVCPDN